MFRREFCYAYTATATAQDIPIFRYYQVSWLPDFLPAPRIDSCFRSRSYTVILTGPRKGLLRDRWLVWNKREKSRAMKYEISQYKGCRKASAFVVIILRDDCLLCISDVVLHTASTPEGRTAISYICRIGIELYNEMSVSQRMLFAIVFARISY